MIRALRTLALPVAALAFVALPAEAQDIDVSGSWEFSQEGPRGNAHPGLSPSLRTARPSRAAPP